MTRRALTAFALFAGFLSGGPFQGRAAEPAGAEKARAASLVRKLGDESFEVRRRAGEELLEMGPAAEEALVKGAADSDAEIRERARALLSRLAGHRRQARLKAFVEDKTGELKSDLAGWERFSQLTGSGPASRELFAGVYRASADLLELAQSDPKAASGKLAGQAANLRLRLITPKVDETALAEVMGLLLLTGDSKLKVEPAVRTHLLDGLETLAERPALVKQVQDSAPARALVLHFLKETAPLGSERVFGVARDLGLRESAPWALAVALDKRAPGPGRASALLLLGKLGDKTTLPKLEPLLEDESLVGARPLGGATLRAEVRDVALAASVELSGGKPGDYGYPYLQAVPGLKTLPSATCLGFATPAQREAALGKWKARAGKP